jgi:hypothetical protein
MRTDGALACVINPGRSKRSIGAQIESFANEMNQFVAYTTFSAETDGDRSIFLTYDSAVQARARCTEISSLMKRRRLPATVDISAANSATLNIVAKTPSFTCRTLKR